MTAFASEEQHNKQVNNLLNHPEKIVIDKTETLEHRISMSCSPRFFNKKGRIISTPDGLLFGRWGDIYLFEYKTSGHRKKAYHQLQKYFKNVQEQFGERARLFYITGGLNGEPYKTIEVRR